MMFFKRRKHARRDAGLLALVIAAALALSVPAAVADSVLTLPKSLTVIEEEAFYGDQSLTDVAVPEGVTRIGARAFSGSGLKRIKLPASLTAIDGDPFDGPGRVTVIAQKGTYAYGWAVQNGYIVEPRITREPEDLGIATGLDSDGWRLAEDFSFSVTAENAAAYQWQYSTDGVRWYDIIGARQSVYGDHTSLNALDVPYLYRCRVTSASGGVAYTRSAHLFYDYNVVITKQPEIGAYSISTAIIYNYYTLHYSLTALNAASYQWQICVEDGMDWENFGEEVVGPAGHILSVNLHDNKNDCIRRLKANGKFRCRVTGVQGDVVYSDAVGYDQIKTPRIYTQPEDQMAASGDTVTLSLKIEPFTGERCWQISDDGGNTWTNMTLTDADRPSMSFVADAATLDKHFRFRMVDSSGEECVSNVVRLIDVNGNPVARITRQPVSCTTKCGEPAMLSVEASNAVSYQWQYYSTSDAKWVNYGGETDKTFSINVSLVYTGQYRCAITGTDGRVVYSNAVTVTVEDYPYITQQPTNCISRCPSRATQIVFELSASRARAYQWQVSTDAGTTWSDITDESSATHAWFGFWTNDLLATSKNLYRCRITGESGDIIYSDIVKVETIPENTTTIEFKELPPRRLSRPVIGMGGGMLHPELADYGLDMIFYYYNGEEVVLGAQVVNGTGMETEYQWECSCDQGVTWETLESDIYQTSESIMSDGVSRLLYVDVRGFIVGQAETEGAFVRLHVSFADGTSMYGDTYVLAMNGWSGIYPPLAMRRQPEDQPANAGEQVTFTVEADNVYCWVWQSSTDGVNWTPVAGSRGRNAAPSQEPGIYTFSLKATAENLDNTLYRCRMMCWGGAVFSSESVRIVGKHAEITVQPTDQQASSGESVVFWVGARHASQYQWQSSVDGGRTWKNVSGATQAVLKATAPTGALNQTSYRCGVTGPDGMKVTSSSATIVAKNAAHSHTWQPIIQRRLVVDEAGSDFEANSCCNCGFVFKLYDEQSKHSMAMKYNSSEVYSGYLREGLYYPLHPHNGNSGTCVSVVVHFPATVHFEDGVVGYRCSCGMTKPAD